MSGIVLSIVGGGFLYATGLPERMETVFQDNVLFYRQWQERKQRVWMSSRQGLLAGKITEIISAQKIRIKGLKRNVWVIDIGDTIWRGQLSPDEDLKIKILGQMKGKGQFIANEIWPWQGRKSPGRMHHSRFRERMKKNRRNVTH